MVTLSTADKVLKTLYLDVICDQLNNRTNPFYAAIKKGNEEISGKNAVAVCRYGINGGMGSAQETGSLPVSAGNNYINLTADLKNLYGTIEISDKAIRASQNSSSALVNVLNAEMEGLLEAAKFNFSRMLWQNGLGILSTVADLTGHNSKNYFPVESTANFIEGMVIDFINADEEVVSAGHRVTKVDRTAKTVYINPAVGAAITVAKGDMMTLQQSYGAELNGIPYLFDSDMVFFYGQSRLSAEAVLPQSTELEDDFTADAMQATLDQIEERSGNDINMILTSYDVRRKYLSYMQSVRLNIDYMNVDGGFKALSYNGIPVVADKFCTSGAMYFVNTNDFKLVQLCDWQWLEGDNGSILVQLEKAPAYTGTLVKYANLLCTRPYGQGKLYNIN